MKPTNDAVTFYVSDVKKVAMWYSKLLGFRIEWENSDYGYIYVDNTRIGFRFSASNRRSQNVVYLNVPSLSEKIESVKTMGGSLYREPTQTQLGEYSCVMADPFGSHFGLTSWLR